MAHTPAGTESRAGSLLREWRQRRRLSQLDLALAADTSARHLSYVETGRAKPSRAERWFYDYARRWMCRCASATRC
ncbi:helix-turn-helix domain-containing protein [Nocardia sp. NBC_00881]|uniref:helix-turn-helix domain-containing protein n=1 Tax=Nocardia sp. NBC_00881 TaxID=2975995 RepID=UPI00386A7492